MKLRNASAALLSLALLAGTLFPTAAFAGDKRRIAILPFEYGAVTANVGTVDVGKGITSMLVTKFVQDGTYAVVERQALDSILKEQNFSQSDRADASTACKIGKLLSVDAIVLGTVSQFGVEKKSSGMNIPAVAGMIPYAGGYIGSLGSFHKKSAQAKVAIEARLVDTNTGEVLATANGTGESKTKGSWSINSDWDWNSSDFTTSVAGEATVAAVNELCGQLEAQASKIPDNQSLVAQNVRGEIADVTGKTVIINVGKKNGVKPGDTFQVERVVKTVKDPETGKVLKEVTNTIGVVSITEADDGSSTGTLLKDAGARVGDVIKKVTTEVSAIVLTPLPSSTSAKPTAAPTATASNATSSKKATK